MSLFQQAAALNNRGVTALRSGDYAIATSSMGQAVQLLQTELVSSRSPSSSYDDMDTGDSSSMKVDDSSSMVAQRYLTQKVSIPCFDTDDTGVPFQQAVFIPVDISSPSEIDLTIYSAVVIFNLALAFHVQSTGEGSFMKDVMLLINKADKLYSMVLKLVDEKTMVNHTALIVKLACVNNLSQLRYHMMMDDEDDAETISSREGLKQISHWFMRQPSHQVFLEDSEIQSLFVNALLLKPPTVARAA